MRGGGFKMKASLSDEQRQAIQQPGGLPLEIADQQSNQVFFLISAEQYQKARRILEGVEEIDPSLYEVEDVELTDAQ
jgi:ribosomal protein L22